MQMPITWKPQGNDEVQTTGLKFGDERIFVFVANGVEGDQHTIQPYPAPNDYQGELMWTLRGPGGAAGPKLWRQTGLTPKFGLIIGSSVYSSFGGNQTLQSLGLKAGETYALCGRKDPNSSDYTGPLMGNSVCTLTNGA